jgi:hypothetical protein
MSAVRYWASSGLARDASGLVGHITARWGIEVLIAGAKELGLAQQQLLSVAGIVRWGAAGPGSHSAGQSLEVSASGPPNRLVRRCFP